MTAEQLHDALGLLPSDLIAEADARRCAPKKTVIRWQRWAAMAACAVLAFGCTLVAIRGGWIDAAGGTMEKSSVSEDMAAVAEPQAPAAAAPTEAPAEEECDCAESLILSDEENGLVPTYGIPPVDVASAEFFFGELSVNDEVHLIKTAAALEALGLGLDVYDEGWFQDFDLLLIALPGITSPERLDVSVGQGMDPHHWEIRLGDDLLERADCADSLLICIPVHKGHIPADTVFEILPK